MENLFEVENQIDVNDPPSPQDRLVSAIYENNVTAARELLASGILIDDSIRDEALTSGNLEIISLLLDHGMPKDQLVPRAARLTDQPQLIRFLLDHGCDLNEEDESGYTAMHLAARSNNAGVLQFLIEEVGLDVLASDHPPLLVLATLASSRQTSKTLRYLISLDKLDINEPDVHGRTPLVHASVNGLVEAVEFLLKNGADPNRVDKFGITPLMLTSESEQGEASRIIHQLGSLVLVRQDAYPKVVELLLHHGADPKRTDILGDRAVSYALKGGNVNIAEMILKARGDTRPLDDFRMKMETLSFGGNTVALARFFDAKLFENTLLRPSEMRESATFSDRLTFSIEEFNDSYIVRDGKTYGESVAGINLSCEALADFYERYSRILTPEESALRDKLPTGEFFLIGINMATTPVRFYGDVLNHELSHAHFFFDAEYRRLALEAWESISEEERNAVNRVFDDVDFVDLVRLDEFAAYAVNNDFLIEIRETEEIRSLIEYFNSSKIVHH